MNISSLLPYDAARVRLYEISVEEWKAQFATGFPRARRLPSLEVRCHLQALYELPPELRERAGLLYVRGIAGLIHELEGPVPANDVRLVKWLHQRQHALMLATEEWKRFARRENIFNRRLARRLILERLSDVIGPENEGGSVGAWAHNLTVGRWEIVTGFMLAKGSFQSFTYNQFIYALHPGRRRLSREPVPMMDCTYERRLGMGVGNWPLVSDDNMEDSIQLLREVCIHNNRVLAQAIDSVPLPSGEG